jgi:gliding motility-associated-like protein
MLKVLRFFIVAISIIASTNLWSQQNVTAGKNCPGVPGACGFPATSTQDQRTNPGNQQPQNGNGTLGVIYNQMRCGLNYTSASQRLGKRFTPAGVTQPAPFPISGIPACAIIERAYLWAEGSGNGMAQTATVNGPAGSFNFPMAIVGQGPDKCWGYSGSYTYRADVTAAINGNGTYNISGILTNPPTSGNDMDGATLIVIWSQPSATWQGRIVIADGAIVVNGGVANFNMPISPAVCGPTTNGSAFFCVGDIQFNPTSWSANGTAAPLTWNWWNYNQVNTNFANSQATCNFNVNTSGDCFNLCVAGAYWRSTTCMTCPAASALTLTPSSSPASCSNCNGSASVSVSGGTAPYTYSWAPSGGNAATATNLCAGTYTVTVTDACANVGTVAITVSTSGGGLTIGGTQTNVSCNGQCTGSANATVTGGTGPYTYSWAPSGGNAATATGLCPGTYTVTVTDANGCTGNRTLTITQPPALTTTGTQTNVLCNGGLTGSASVTPSGGTAPYTYSWAPSGGTGSTATGLGVGTYTVTVTDANGCTSTRTYSITQPPALTATQTQTNILCNGLCTGAASVIPSGGTAPYTYSWAPSGGTASSTTGRCAGTYTVTITDANGCTTTRTFNITQPPAITTTGTQTNVLCNGALTGSASVTPSGGTAPYTYSWAPSGGTGSTATGLGSGTYTVTVTDATGCTTTRTYSITQPSAIATTGAQTNVLCNGGLTGSASVTPSGGTAPYTYSWSPSGGTGSTATGLGVGTYTVTVTDANGCTTTRTYSITQPPALTATASTTPATCGNPNGSATAMPSGGVGPYTNSWAPSGGTGSTATGLLSGTYTVTITDANGCTTTATATVTNTGSPTAAISASTNISCFGGSNGSATVSASGGAGPYSYAWTPSGGTGTTASGLIAGAYTVTVTDANGCTAQATVTLTQPPAITTTGTQTNVLCNGALTGSASVTASGGTAPYTYSWAPSGGTGSTATGLGAGTYTVTVTDANGCTSTRTYTITQPPALTATTTTTGVLCFGGNSGAAAVTASGGIAPYTYSWAPSGGTSSNATGLAAGSYTCTITDANGCTTSASATVTEPPQLTVAVTTTPSTCGNSNGSAVATQTGGTGPYTYLWTPNNTTSATLSNAVAGSYQITVTDANGCTASAIATVNNMGNPVAFIAASDSVSCFGGNDGFAAAGASSGTGPYTFTWSNADTDSLAGGLTAGSYTVTVTDANGCTDTASVIIYEPLQLTATTTQVDVLCFGNSTGSATVTALGGSGAYSYSWAPTGGNTDTASSLPAGSYTCTITDANGCTTTASVTITEPPQLTATATSSDVSCFAGTDGTAAAAETGGTAPYSYAWTPTGGNSAAATGLAAGTYTCTITDANGCTTTASVNITEPNSVNSTLAASANISCFGSADGSIDIDATGGTGPYTYNWLPNVSASDFASGIPAGSYQITVTDGNGCTSVVNVTLTQPPALTITAAAAPAAVCEGTPVTLSATPTGGTPAYTVTWNPGNLSGNNQTITPTQSGAYTADITDANGCTASTVVNITVNPMPTANLSADITSGCAPLCVNFSDLSAALAPAVITGWLWDFGDGNTSNQQNPSHCFDDPGNYNVTLNVTTGAGCSANITMANYINVFANPVAAFGASPQPTTILNPTIFFIDSSSNAVQWNWSFGDLANSSSSDQNPQFTYPDPTCYSVLLTVTSADGCQDTASQIVCIDPDVSIYVPNTFTPNEDGRNDVFFPVTIGIDPNHFEMWIFDRWGNMIYYTDDINDGWDGRVQGASDFAQIDSYVWRIKAKDVLSKKHDLIGHVNLIK